MRYVLVEKVKGTTILDPETEQVLQKGDTIEMDYSDTLERLRCIGLEPAPEESEPAPTKKKKVRK